MNREQAYEKSLEYFKGDTLAANVFLDKYALKTNEGDILEATPDDMHRRLAKEFARIEKKYPNPISEEEIFSYFERFSKIVPQGSPMEGIGNDFRFMSLSNCFVIPSPEDSYGGIFKADQQEAQLMKRRGGVGIDISKIRPKGMFTNNAAKTTDGIAVFMDRFSNTCREVAQNGRRGALMESIDCRHPQVETFINIKRDKTRVTGANISVKLTDAFMQAVKDDTTYTQQWPVDSQTPEISREVRARDIWNQIIDAAWSSAEPGILFWDNVQKNTPSDIYSEEGLSSVSTNPCLIGSTRVLLNDDINGLYDLPIESLINKTVKIHDGRNWVDNSNFRLTGNEATFLITLPDKNTIECTIGHNHNTNYGKLTTKEIMKLLEEKKTIKLKTISFHGNNSYKEYGTIDIISIEPTNRFEDVYCTTVETEHNFVIKTGDINVLTGNCGEIPLPGNGDSCRLLCVNLLGLVKNKFTENAEFDYDELAKMAYIGQKLMDDMIDLEVEKLDKIIEKIISDPESEDVKRDELDLWYMVKKSCLEGRRTGLGITALGDALAAIDVRYGSKESIEITEKIYKILGTNAYRATIDMAEQRGSFPLFKYEKEKNHGYLNRLIGELGPEYLEKWQKFGRRNVCLTTTAPTGTVSLMTQTTSGIEPCFQPVYKRRKKIQSQDERVDFVDAKGDKWQEFEVCHHQFSEWRKISGLTNVEDSPYWGATANDVDWTASVELQAAAQRWICHSISKTANLPNSASKELVAEIYMKAWESGCKGFTIYRDGCRDGVLITNTESTVKKEEEFGEHHAPKRPVELECDVKQVKIKGESWTVFVGLMNNKPYEVFCGKSSLVNIPKSLVRGSITKVGKKDSGLYDFHGQSDAGYIHIHDIVGTFDNVNQATITRFVSMSLRHGTPIHFVVDQLQKDEGDLNSFEKVLARVLKTYIKDGVKMSSKCSNCGAEGTLVYQEGCLRCTSCSYSKCG